MKKKIKNKNVISDMEFSNGRVFYSSKKLLSNTDCDILMSTGGRGIGKTFNYKKLCIDEFIKYNYEFIYLRRTKSDNKFIDNFFSDIQKYYPEYEFSVTKNRFWSKKNDEKEKRVMGYPMILQQVKTLKGSAFENVNTIFFDEFLIDDRDKVAQRYLTNELQRFCDFYESVARNRDVRIIMVSNAVGSNNPYFKGFHLKPVENTITKFKCKGGLKIALEMCDSSKYLVGKEKTRSGKLMIATGMYESSVENKFLLDDPSSLKECPKNASFWMNIIVNKKYYGVYVDNDSHIYFTRKSNPTSKRTYCCYLSDGNENAVYVNGSSGLRDMEMLKSYIRFNWYHFENLDIKFDIEEFLSKVNIIK